MSDNNDYNPVAYVMHEGKVYFQAEDLVNRLAITLIPLAIEARLANDQDALNMVRGSRSVLEAINLGRETVEIHENL